MTPRKVGGYTTRQALTDAMNASKEIGDSLNRLVIENPTPHRAAILVAKASTALNRNYSALIELNQIVNSKTNP